MTARRTIRSERRALRPGIADAQKHRAFRLISAWLAAYPAFWRGRPRLHRDQAGPFVTSEACCRGARPFERNRSLARRNQFLACETRFTLRRNEAETVGAAGCRHGQTMELDHVRYHQPDLSRLLPGPAGRNSQDRRLRRMSDKKPKLAIPTVFSAVLIGVAIWALAGPPAMSKKVAPHHVTEHH